MPFSHLSPLPLSSNPPHSAVLSVPGVLFCGYKVPHPLYPYFLLKIQTDGTLTPEALLEEACRKLIGTLASLETKFKREFSFKEVDGSSGAAGTGVGGFSSGDDPYGVGTGTSGGAWGREDYLDF